MFKFYVFTVLAVTLSVVLAEPLGRRDTAAADVADDWHMVADEAGNLNLLNLGLDGEQEEPSSRFNPYNDMNIFLFTRRNPQVGQRIQVNSVEQLRNSQFNAAHPTRFVIHGWRGNGDANINNIVRQAYFARGEFNVFVVDWGEGANSNYLSSRNRVAEVGRHVALFIDFLVAQTRISFSSITVVGHSLGAHIAGFTGKRVTRGRIQNIVALDPAMPLFRYEETALRVHFSDALYVESIHTDIGRLGFDQPIGHASFYPNWGRLQPGCPPEVSGSCSHERAVVFFVESIRNPRAFYGSRCAGGWPDIQANSCRPTGVTMAMGGEPVAQGANGVYVVAVNAASPFGQGPR